MTKKELLKKIELLELRIAALESRSTYTYIPTQPFWEIPRPYRWNEVTCGDASGTITVGDATTTTCPPLAT